MALSTCNINDNKTLIINSMNEVENVSFRKFIIDYHAKSMTKILLFQEKMKFGYITLHKMPHIVKKANQQAEIQFNQCISEKIPQAFLDILEKPMKKTEQIKILKEAQLTSLQLGALFAQAEMKGYSFSHYKYKGNPTFIKKEELPHFIHIKEDESLEFYGETPLTEGQMRQIVKQANVIIARIMDNGEHWHCILQTFKGLEGKEPGMQGSKPHLHYISDSFGISRENLVAIIHNGRYPRSPVHILLLDK